MNYSATSAFNSKHVHMSCIIVIFSLLSGDLVPTSSSLYSKTDVLIRAHQCTIW